MIKRFPDKFVLILVCFFQYTCNKKAKFLCVNKVMEKIVDANVVCFYYVLLNTEKSFTYTYSSYYLKGFIKRIVALVNSAFPSFLDCPQKAPDNNALLSFPLFPHSLGQFPQLGAKNTPINIMLTFL